MGADVNRESGNDDLPTPLHLAVSRQSLPCVEVLLEQAKTKVDAPNTIGFTALHLCSSNAREAQSFQAEKVFADIAAALMRRGADMNKVAPKGGGLTPLTNAIENGMCRVVAKMVELGEKPPAPGVEQVMKQLKGQTGEPYESMLDIFVNAGWGPRDVNDTERRTAAALEGIQKAVKGSPTDGTHQRSSRSCAQHQSFPLHDAAKNGNVDALAEHLSSGADVNAVDRRGGTALHAAAMHGHDDIVEALLGADGIFVDKPDASKLTALFGAAVADQVGAVKALLKAGASPHVKDHKGEPLLNRVVARPAGAVLEALLDHGASPGGGGEKGVTPLHVACRTGTSGTVEALLRAGALPGHCWNESLQSPLVLACRHGNLGAVQQLLPVLSKRQMNMRTGVIAGAETALGAAIRCTKLTMDTVAIVEAVSFFFPPPYGTRILSFFYIRE